MKYFIIRQYEFGYGIRFEIYDVYESKKKAQFMLNYLRNRFPNNTYLLCKETKTEKKKKNQEF